MLLATTTEALRLPSNHRAQISMQAEGMTRVGRGEPMPWKLAETKKQTAARPTGFTAFYSKAIPTDDPAVSCWLAPEGDENGKYICARDCDLWSDGLAPDDSY